MKTTRVVWLCFVLLFGLMSTNRAANYYVNSSAGNDSNTGRSSTTPYKTIQKAAGIMIAGDSCFVAPGNYPERISLKRSGSSGLPIVFIASSSGVVTKGFTILASYITVDGFEVTQTTKTQDTSSPGFYIKGQYVRILNNYIHNTYLEGIDLGGGFLDTPETSNCLIKGNRIVRCGMAGLQVCGQNNIIEGNDISGTVQWSLTCPDYPDYIDADGMRFFGSGHTIRNNRIHDIYLSDPENSRSPHIDCAQSWGPASNIVFEQNDFSLAGEPNATKQIAMISYGDQNTIIKNLTFRNNIFHDVYRGLNLFGSMDGYPNTPIDGLTIVNNTFAYFTTNPIELHDAPNARVFNNIFFNSRQVWTDAATTSKNLQIGYNNYYNCSNLSSTANTGDIRLVDPGFVAPLSGNFQLQSTSPLIDKGTSLSMVTNDYAGTSRPQGAAFDIGAYEYKQTVPQSPPTTDVTSPKIFSAVLSSSTSLKITFSEKISSAEAIVKSNYSITGGIRIKKITVSSTQDAVILTTSSHRVNTAYTVTVFNVKDLYGNVISSSGNTATYKMGSAIYQPTLGKANDQMDSGINPEDYQLIQNFPNPFNPSTLITFNIPENSLVTLKVYDILGKEVATLVNEVKERGLYQVEFNGSGLSSGTYIYQLNANGNIQTRKMIIAK